jgi:hypothetical protein
MFRNCVAAAVALFVFVGGLSAAEYKGKVTKIDTEKNTITINVKKDKKDKTGEDKTFTIAKDAKFTSVKKKNETTLTDGLKNEAFAKVGEKDAPTATLVTKGEGKDEVVTEIKVSVGKKKKNADK